MCTSVKEGEVRVKFTLEQATKVQTRISGIALLFNLGAGCERVVNATAWPLYLQESPFTLSIYLTIHLSIQPRVSQPSPEPTVSSTNQAIPYISWKHKVHRTFQPNPPLVPILSRMNPVYLKFVQFS
jgi:hypothetical protein